MKKFWKKLTASFLVMAMVCTTLFGALPSLEVLAAPKMMAHLKAGSGNGNGHFGSGNPEAFILSDNAGYTDEDFSFTFKLGSTNADTRFRFVTKYADDSNWGYIAYDGATNWFYEFKNNGSGSYPSLEGLPAVQQNDIVNVSGTYETDGLHITVENTTSGQKGTAVADNADFLALKDKEGQVGFGAATYGEAYTDIYFSDVTVGENAYQSYDNWQLYKDAEGQVWEPAVEVSDGEGEEPSQQGRAWYKITGGRNNGGGHAYGNPNVSAPILLLDNDKRMGEGGELSLAVKPSGNWGVFYSYMDDNNWLYVGYDGSSKWYYQYNLNGSGSYPGIAGLPDPVEGEELSMSISLNRETLSVTVNGTTVRVTNQDLISFAEKTKDQGRFGVKTNGATSISFADVKYNGENCMEDNWGFCAERDGQLVEKTYTALVPVTGTVTSKETGEPVADASVRLGTEVTTTDADGHYQFASMEVGEYSMAVTKPEFQAYLETVTLEEDKDNVFDIQLEEKKPLDLSQYDTIQSDVMKVYIGKDFPIVARYEMLSDAETFFRGNEQELNEVAINGVAIKPEVTLGETTQSSREYVLHIEDAETELDFDMTVKISVENNDVTWQVTDIKKADGCAKIATIDVPNLNLLTVDSIETGANFAGALASTTTTSNADVYINFNDGFIPADSTNYLYGFLTNGKLSAGLFSNSEAEGDKRVVRNNGADTMSLTSAPWYYELGDKNGQKYADRYEDYPVSELPVTKVAIGADENQDGDIDWNDGALAFRDIMNIPYGSDVIKDLVNYRIVMNFGSMTTNPYLETADNIKKVYLATDGLPQAVMLKGYGNEGHDSANSEYADISEREGGVKDFQNLIKIAHDYNTEIGIHVNAQEAYPEAKSFCEPMIGAEYGIGNGWGWLDQSKTIDKLWDLSSQARWKRFVQLYDRINGTDFYSRDWDKGEYVEDSKGEVKASKEEIQKDAENRKDNMDFIYLDVWYQDSWETRQVAKEINSLGWRFTTEFSAQGEYDSTWQHWSTDATYGGASSKGFNSDIIRFIRNDQRDSQVLNYPSFGGTADNPLLGGARIYGFEGWGGDQNYTNYIYQTFNQNLPTKFLQHYYVSDWVNYDETSGEESPVGNHEKQISLMNDEGDKVVVTRNEAQRSDEEIERTITLNDKVILNTDTEGSSYLLPWTDNQDGTEKLYHWNLDGGTTTWELQDDWTDCGNVIVYELSDQGRINERTVPVVDGKVTLDAKAATAYVVVKGAGEKTLKADFGEDGYVVDPGFNGYPGAGEKLSSDEWSGDIDSDAIVVEKDSTGDQTLAFNSPDKDVKVTTQISGLEKGKDYVAIAYVDNESDAKATMTVCAGDKETSNYTMRSVVPNSVASDEEHGSNMQRMLVSFVAEGKTADLTFARKAGEGATYFDDIRVVQKTLNNFQKDGSFTQDFESVAEGLYPFVTGRVQAGGDQVSHLSQLHEPYTQTGWNGRVIDDVIDGEYSLKHHGTNTGIIFQTVPQNFHFEAGKVYTVEFDYQSGPDKAYGLVIGSGAGTATPADENWLAQARGEEGQKHFKTTFTASGDGQTWIGIYENGGLAGSGSMGETDLVIDNLVIKEDPDAISVAIDKTELYKGETATISGSNLEKVTWKSSDEKVAKVEDNKVLALEKGTAVLTAEIPNAEAIEFTITVLDQVVVDIDGLQMTAAANTEYALQPAGNAVDGNSGTWWHSNWAGEGFVVSPENPAILTVDLGKAIEFGGFKFQQRNDSNVNGIVRQFSYRILDENKEEIASASAVTVDKNLQSNGAWVETQFDSNVAGRYIEFSIEVGGNDFAAVTEIAPFAVQKVAEEISMDDAKVNIGETVEMQLKHEEGTLVKGIVWSSSDEEVATVDQNGVVKGVKEGTATITASNVAGLSASATVTVGEAIESEVSVAVLKYAIELAKKVDTTDVIPAIVTEFEARLANANDIVAKVETGDKTVTQEMVDNSWKALIDIMQYLSFKQGDKTDLEKVIAFAESLDMNDYVDDEKKDAFLETLDAAKVVRDDPNAMQKEIDDAWMALLKATAELNRKMANKEDLNKVIEWASALDLSLYLEEGQDTFNTALATAKEVAEDFMATQKQVDDAWKALMDAASALRLKPDKSALEALINQAQAMNLEGANEADVEAFSTALASAVSVLNNDQADRDLVETATKELQASIDNLLASTSGTPDQTDDTKAVGSGSSTSNNDKASGASDTGNQSVKSAKTGDAANPVAIIVLLVVAAAIVGGVIVYRRKNKE